MIEFLHFLGSPRKRQTMLDPAFIHSFYGPFQRYQGSTARPGRGLDGGLIAIAIPPRQFVVCPSLFVSLRILFHLSTSVPLPPLLSSSSHLPPPLFLSLWHRQATSISAGRFGSSVWRLSDVPLSIVGLSSEIGIDVAHISIAIPGRTPSREPWNPRPLAV